MSWKSTKEKNYSSSFPSPTGLFKTLLVYFQTRNTEMVQKLKLRGKKEEQQNQNKQEERYKEDKI